MMRNCSLFPVFLPGMNAISLVSHPPEIQSGDLVKIVKAWSGNLYAVQMPGGMIHRWFTSFELISSGNACTNVFSPGELAIVKETTGHGTPPHIEAGTTVKILSCIHTIFYDVTLSNGEYHRWLAEFEVAKSI